jgi:hypothetical protein
LRAPSLSTSSADVLGKQLGSLSATTELVGITVGSNDLGLVEVLQVCADPRQVQACTTRLGTLQLALRATLPAAVGKTLTSVVAKAPKAKLVVVGYPLPFEDGADGCGSFGVNDGSARSRPPSERRVAGTVGQREERTRTRSAVTRRATSLVWAMLSNSCGTPGCRWNSTSTPALARRRA